MTGYAGLGRRTGALALDALVSLAWALPLMEKTTSRGTGGSLGMYLELGSTRYAVEGASFLLFTVLWFAYFIVTEAAFGGTIGKLLLGIRVVGADGRRAGLGAVFIRNALRVVGGFPYVLPYLVGWSVALNDKPGRRRVGDRVAKTYVVLKGTAPAAPPPVPPPPV